VSQDVEREHHRRSLDSCPRRIPAGNAEAFLKRTEVRAPGRIGDDDLTVDQCVDGQLVAGLDQLGKS